MIAHETLSAELRHQDSHIVDQALDEIRRYATGPTANGWQAKMSGASERINALYEEFVPQADEIVRAVGRSLGSVGIAFLETRYGPDEYAPKLYGGSYEHNVLATYHHSGHSWDFMRGMFRYAEAVNREQPGTYDHAAFAHFPVIASLHDSIMGNGRGNDERQSGLLAAKIVGQTGLLACSAEVSSGIYATTWDAERNLQSVDLSRPHVPYQRAAAVGDLLPVFTPDGPYSAVCLAVEDMTKRMHGQVLTVEAEAAGFDLENVDIEDCLNFIDTSQRAREVFAGRLAGQAGFYKNFKGADPRLDDIFPGRSGNVELAENVSRKYTQGRLAAVDVLAVCRDYRQNAAS